MVYVSKTHTLIHHAQQLVSSGVDSIDKSFFQCKTHILLPKSVQQRLGETTALSRKLKPHLVADTVKQYISRAQRTAKGSQEQPNMEFLRGVYAFMQVSRSSVSVALTNLTKFTNPSMFSSSTFFF
uniref:Uncharacterized protein n=1 Tax=Glossina pallidipes TaxID=7398 RepID=A0A1B0A106_GLOPL